MAVEIKRKILSLFSSSARAAGVSQSSGEVVVDSYQSASLLVDITALGGTPDTVALDVKLQYSPDTSGSRWIDLPNGAITQLTATGRARIESVSLLTARRVKAVYTLAFTGGTAPTATFAVDVAISQLPASSSNTPAGENHIGSIGGKQATISVTPTLTVAATYVSGDYVGESAVPITFDNVARVVNGSGVIQSAQLIDKALASIPAELFLFDTAITPPADSAAWTLSDADMAHCIGVIPFSAYFASALNSVSPVNNLGIAFKCVGNDDKIYGALVTRGAPAYANGDVVIKLQVLQD